MIITWIITSFVISAVYITYAALNHNIFANPGDFGDLLAGISAFISLPGILIVLFQNARDEKRRRKEFSIDIHGRQLQTDMHVFEHLNQQFDEYGHDIRYMLKSTKDIKRKVTWDKWENKDNVWAYIKASYFNIEHKQHNLKAIASEKNVVFVCRRFCAHVDIVIGDLEKLNKKLNRNPELMKAVKTHPVCVVAEELKKTL